ncbi:uncharacterized protein LOC108040065 [Drosophila rhopaloa]|uniref:Uncharacterized protein n=1 Tax=Drosophila rhopaloa TaxID=1041015 RepID=A0ABM5H0U5_DRORH|nr:uncharacterized protein LOC108040065 [Drosophila rhopaloa]
MSSSETDFIAEEDEPPGSFAPAPVSPNPNLQASQSVVISPSVSITSVDGSHISESEDSYVDWQPHFSETGIATSERMEVGAIPEHWLYGLRSVPATTNLRPRRRWNSVSRSGSPTASTSSTSTAPFPQQYSNLDRRPHWGDSHYIDNESEHVNRISDILMDMESRSQRIGSRRSRQRRNRRIQAQARAIFRAQRLLNGSATDVDDFSDLDSTDRLPRNMARVPRRGNSISDCSQCSSDDEQDKIKGKNKPTVPSHLVEWLYPV